MAKSSQLLSVNVSLLKIGQNIGSREVATIPSAPQLRPGSRNSRCRAFGVGMGAPQGVQTRQSPVFPAPGRVFLKEIGMLATFISLLGSLAQAQIVWIGDVNTNFASQRVSNLGRIIGHGHFCCFFGANKIIARMTILFGYHTAVYKKNRPVRRSVFCGSCKIRVKRQTARDERCIPNEYPRFWSPIRPGGEGLASGA